MTRLPRRPRVLVLIAARAGSKGLRHKNVRKLAGVPLLARAIECALAARLPGTVASVLVSTDSRRYATIARAAGAEVPTLRPRALATDGTRLADVVLHVLETQAQAGRHYDSVVLLSATTPLTTPRDVRSALRLHFAHDGAPVVSVTADDRPGNWWLRAVRGRLVTDGDPRIGRRQAGAPAYVFNGAIFVATVASLRKHGQFFVSGRTLALRMPADRSLDIESAADLRLAAALLALQEGTTAARRRR